MTVAAIGSWRAPTPAIPRTEPLLAASMLRRAPAELGPFEPAVQPEPDRVFPREWVSLPVPVSGHPLARQGEA
jgi:hypothetical protein